MSVARYLRNLKVASTLDFTDNELSNFRDCINGLYRILKHVYDSPRRIPRLMNSVTALELSRELVYQSPDEYYRFVCNEVTICVRYRYRSKCYSVACTGWNITREIEKAGHLLQLDKVEKVDKDDFSCGFYYYGRFTRENFTECVNYYFAFLKLYIQTRLDEAFTLF